VDAFFFILDLCQDFLEQFSEVFIFQIKFLFFVVSKNFETFKMLRKFKSVTYGFKQDILKQKFRGQIFKIYLEIFKLESLDYIMCKFIICKWKALEHAKVIEESNISLSMQVFMQKSNLTK
jgi:hypothetical protein